MHVSGTTGSEDRSRVLHLERFELLTTGESIVVVCDCGFGRDHLTRRGVPVDVP